RVVEHRRRRVQREGAVRLDPRVVPPLLLLEVGQEHVVGEDLPEPQLRVLRLGLERRRLRHPDRLRHRSCPPWPVQKMIGWRYRPKAWRYTSEICPRET